MRAFVHVGVRACVFASVRLCLFACDRRLVRVTMSIKCEYLLIGMQEWSSLFSKCILCTKMFSLSVVGFDGLWDCDVVRRQTQPQGNEHIASKQRFMRPGYKLVTSQLVCLVLVGLY